MKVDKRRSSINRYNMRCVRRGTRRSLRLGSFFFEKDTFILLIILIKFVIHWIIQSNY